MDEMSAEEGKAGLHHLSFSAQLKKKNDWMVLSFVLRRDDSGNFGCLYYPNTFFPPRISEGELQKKSGGRKKESTKT